MPTPTLLSSAEAGILTLTLNRPDKLNALNHETLADLHQALLHQAATNTACAKALRKKNVL